MNIIITGGSGLIGGTLTKLLKEKGYPVFHLTRKASSKYKIRNFIWNYEKNYIDKAFIELIKQDDFVLIHLAGEGIADERWSPDRKEAIVNSRVKSLEFLMKVILHNNGRIKQLISAGGTGFYGARTNDFIYHEEDYPHDDFMANCCVLWEEAAMKFEQLCPVTIFRTPMVLSPYGGALSKLQTPFKFGVTVVMGTGKQYMPWIHYSDLCNAYYFAIEHSLSGTYNVVAPEHVTNAEFSKKLNRFYKFRLFTLHMKIWFLKLILGELQVMLTEGSRVDGGLITRKGFSYQYTKLDSALENVMKK